MMLAPEISEATGGDVEAVHQSGQLHYTLENYDFCEMFVVDAALRLDFRDFRLWMPQTYGDMKRAEAAAAANGGRLPADWE